MEKKTGTAVGVIIVIVLLLLLLPKKTSAATSGTASSPDVTGGTNSMVYPTLLPYSGYEWAWNDSTKMWVQIPK